MIPPSSCTDEDTCHGNSAYRKSTSYCRSALSVFLRVNQPHKRKMENTAEWNKEIGNGHPTKRKAARNLLQSITMITTLNVQNIKANAVAVQQLLTPSGILCLQEHWLFDFETHFLNGLSNCHSYHSKSVDAGDPISPLQRPRGCGGVAIIWPSDWDSKVERCHDGGVHIVAITIKCNPRNLCVINTYMPTRGTDSIKDYEDCLDHTSRNSC